MAKSVVLFESKCKTSKCQFTLNQTARSLWNVKPVCLLYI